MPRILSVSYDATLLRTRQMLLERAGYEVVSTQNLTEALEKCRSTAYDLVIMGHSIPRSDKQDIIRALRQHCPAPVLALLRGGEAPLKEAADSIDPFNPSLLLSTVERILNSRKKASAG